MTKLQVLIAKSSFKRTVLEIVKSIRLGETLSYKEVAQRAGNPKAYRVVGNILKANFDPQIPCHRVIKSDGQMGEYNRGMQNKCVILTNERIRAVLRSIF